MNRKINAPHDKFFRAAMEHKPVAIDFFNHYLPHKVRRVLDVNSLELTGHSYIDTDLRESLSDLVFRCELACRPTYLTLLIEHQSTADRMLPFRVHHYLFGMLHSHRKQHPDKPLPAVYTLVFYHGEVTPYPYSLDLWDCFDDPCGLMREVLYQPLPLIDVNQLPDEALRQQQWVGPMVRALKYIRQRDMAPYALDILEALPWSLEDGESIELLELLLNYLLSAGNIEDVNAFIALSAERLSGPVRSEIMTFAEKLKQQGIQEGMQEGIQKGVNTVALTMLKEGAETPFIARMTGLSMAEIERLRVSLESEAG